MKRDNSKSEFKIYNIGKTKFSYYILMITFLLFSCRLIYAAGITSAEFLKIGANARGIAIGGAFTAIADDVNSIYWNCGGLAQLKNTQISLTHNIWLDNINYDYIVFSYPLFKGFNIGSSITYLNTGKIKGYDIDGNETSEFINYDLAGSFAISFELLSPITNNPMYFGVDVKYIYEQIESERGQTISYDIGHIHKLGDLSLGITIQNLGNNIGFVQDNFSLPMIIKTGIAYKLLKENIMLAFDVNFPKESSMFIATGIECKLNLIGLEFVGRAGYNNRISKELGNISGVSAGAGFGVGGILIDYAWVPFGDLGQTQQISLSYKF